MVVKVGVKMADKVAYTHFCDAAQRVLMRDEQESGVADLVPVLRHQPQLAGHKPLEEVGLGVGANQETSDRLLQVLLRADDDVHGVREVQEGSGH